MLKEKEVVIEEIERRSTFSYRYRRFFVFNNFDKSYCCWCKPKRKREDHLFKSARGKLNEELDILEIIKKLRVSQFANELSLKPHQRDLINFF